MMLLEVCWCLQRESHLVLMVLTGWRFILSIWLALRRGHLTYSRAVVLSAHFKCYVKNEKEQKDLILVWFLARDVIYTSRTRCNIYISCLFFDVSVRLSVCLWTNLGLKFRSQFTTHCGRGACGREGRDHRWKTGGIILHYASHC